MDIDPVIRKDRVSLHDQHHGQIVPVAEAIRSLDDLRWRRRLKGMNEITERHGGDEVLTSILNRRAGRCPPADTFDPSVAVAHALDADTAERRGTTPRE